MDFTSPQSLQSLAQLLSGSTSEQTDLAQRLNLYQVFARLCDQHRGLLQDILDLENLNEVCETSQGTRLVPRYVVAMREGSIPCLLTNLVDHQTLRFYQPQGTWIIGRSEDAALCIADRLLSRYHAAIQYSEVGFELVDLKSLNGSFVNKERVSYRQRLHEGDRIRVGGVSFTFHDATVNTQKARVLPAIAPPLQQTIGLSLGDLCAPARSGALPQQDRVPEDTMAFLKHKEEEAEEADVSLSPEQKQSVLERLKQMRSLG